MDSYGLDLEVRRGFVMDKILVTTKDSFWAPLLGQWVARKNEGSYTPGRSQYIGLVQENGMIRAVSEFSDFNGTSILMHCAGEGRNWLNREFLWFSFYYPFVQLGAKKLISPVEAGNAVCRRFIEHIGFSLEATLTDCAPAGDLLLYTMGKDQCRWLTLRGNYGEAESTRAA
jgi:hypothetical protein